MKTPTRRTRLPVIAVTAGDPCGIGPEVLIKAIADRRRSHARLVVIGDAGVFEQEARRLKQRLPGWMTISVDEVPHHLTRVAATDPSRSNPSARMLFIDIAHRTRFVPGRASAAAGAASVAYLDIAISLCREGLIDALVTAPVTKWAVQSSGVAFSGHTEYLSARLGNAFPVMMFASEDFRVVLLTRHIALRDVSAHATASLIRKTLRVVIEALRRDFGCRSPRMVICGLNPHAGEAGLMGTEEERRLAPVLRIRRQRLWNY